MNKENKPSKIMTVLVLQLAVLIFSSSGILIKLAGEQPFLSALFLLYYLAALVVTFLYALIWQQILRRVPLNTAFSNRAVCVIWSMVWGALIFGEEIRWTMVLGAMIIIAGVILVVTADV